jgi:hypothetical protein
MKMNISLNHHTGRIPENIQSLSHQKIFTFRQMKRAWPFLQHPALIKKPFYKPDAVDHL